MRTLGAALLAAGLTAGTALAQTLPDTIPRGALLGTVLDASTGEPLSGTLVVLDPRPGGAITPAAAGSAFWAAARSVLTDGSGVYRFDRVAPGAYRLRVRRVGYQPASLELGLEGVGSLRLSVGLMLRPVLLEPERVVAGPASFTSDGDLANEPLDGRLEAELLRQDRYPSTDVRMLTRGDVEGAVTLGETDLFRAFHRLPGVSTRDDFTAALWTRGASWSHTRVYFDGMPLFNPLHTVGVFSGISPDAVGAVYLHPGVRSAALGEGAAAVLDVTSRRASDGFNGAAELSMVSARATADHGFGPGAGWLISARRSHVDVATDLLGDSADAVPYAFFDIAARGDVRLGHNAALEASTLWERDAVHGTVRDLLRDTEGSWGNGVGRVTLTAPLGSLYARHTVGVSRFDGHLRVAAFRVPGPGELAVPTHDPTDNVLTSLTLRSHVEPPHGRWAAGVDVTLQRQQYFGPPPRPYPQAILADSLLLETELPVLAVWGETRRALGAFTAVVGIRADFAGDVTNAGPIGFGPRLTVRWAPDTRTGVSLGFGRSYQYTQAVAPAGPGVGPDLYLTDVWLLAGDTIPAIRADIVTAGGEAWVGDGWLLAANAYARRETGVAVPDPRPGTLEAARPIFVPGEGRAVGLELSARHLVGPWMGSVAYTIGVSRLIAAEWSYAAPEDRRHTLDATAMTTLGRSLRLGAAMTAASGAPYTRFILGPVDCDSIVGGCPPGDTTFTARVIEAPGTARTGAYVALDLLGEWARAFGGWRLGIYVQVRNVLGRRNAVTYTGSYESCVATGPDERQARAGVCDRFNRGVPLLPFAGVSVSF